MSETRTSANGASSAVVSRRRKAIAVVGVAVVVVVGVAVMTLRVDRQINGWTISIANECGYAVYAMDAGRGRSRTIQHGETMEWDGATKSREKVTLLWRQWPDRPISGPGLTVRLEGDSTLIDDTCPDFG
jgi:hypothetical protein